MELHTMSAIDPEQKGSLLNMKTLRVWAFDRRNLAILAVVLLALGLRIWAAWQLPEDYDEPIYVEGAYDYAELIRAGDWQGLIDYSKGSEHPPLTRVLYSAVFLARPHG